MQEQREFTHASATREVALLDIDGVAARLGVTVRHVRRLVAERRIPYIKWGRRLRFDPAHLGAWLDEHRVPVGIDTHRR